MGYLDPRSNTFKPAPLGITKPVDHIYPVKDMLALPRINKLTLEQQILIIHDRIDVGNFQPLPQSFHSSKGSKTDWSFYKGEALDPVYQNNLIEHQAVIKKNIQRHMDQFYQQNKSEQ